MEVHLIRSIMTRLHNISLAIFHRYALTHTHTQTDSIRCRFLSFCIFFTSKFDWKQRRNKKLNKRNACAFSLPIAVQLSAVIFARARLFFLAQGDQDYALSRKCNIFFPVWCFQLHPKQRTVFLNSSKTMMQRLSAAMKWMWFGILIHFSASCLYVYDWFSLKIGFPLHIRMDRAKHKIVRDFKERHGIQHSAHQ